MVRKLIGLTFEEVSIPIFLILLCMCKCMYVCELCTCVCPLRNQTYHLNYTRPNSLLVSCIPSPVNNTSELYPIKVLDTKTKAQECSLLQNSSNKEKQGSYSMKDSTSPKIVRVYRDYVISGIGGF